MCPQKGAATRRALLRGSPPGRPALLGCFRPPVLLFPLALASRFREVIFVEDLNVSGMLRNRHLSRALADGALAELQRQLEYKALWYGRTFVRVGRWFPSSKRCSACRVVVEKLPLSARRWATPEGGI